MRTSSTTFASARFAEHHLPGLTIDQASLPAGFVGSRHAHEGYHVIFVVEGAVEDHGLSRSEAYAPGRTRLSPSGDRHLMRALRPSRLLQISAAPLTDDMDDRLPTLARRCTRDVAGTGETIYALLRALTSPRMNVLDIETLALGLLRLDPVSPPRSAHQPWLDRVVERLHADFNQTLSLGDVCRDAGVSREHAIRAFRARFGCTMGDYVRRLRVQCARQALAGEQPLALIAREAGFADQSHMTRSLTRALGKSPGRIRRESQMSAR